jgi:menaquinone-dependent protoporphyrinogen IX oxidase
MRAIVVYDSRSRSCQRVAEEVAELLHDVPVAAAEVDVMDVEAADLVVVGGPALRHGLGSQLDAFFDRLPVEGLHGLQAAAFGTKVVGSHLLRSPAAGIARELQHRGARLAQPPESFLALGEELDLQEGELERARKWAVRLLERAHDVAQQRVAGAGLSSPAAHGVLWHAGAHHFPAVPVTIRWSGTKVPEPDEEEGEASGRR